MKRFTETNKWADPWFRRLSPPAKFLWLYLTDHCDCTGLIDLDLETVSFFTGLAIEEKHLTELVDRVQRTEDGKVFIPRFIPFQYGRLSESCPAHKPVLKLVKERNLSINGKGYQYPSVRLSDRVALPLPKGSERVQEKEKDKEKSTEGEVQEGGKRRPQHREEVIAFVRVLGLPEADGHYLFDHWEGNGYRNAGKAILDWRATIRSWQRAGHLPSQRKSGESAFLKTPDCLRMSWPRDWQEARRQVRFLEGKRAEHPGVADRIEALTAQFKLE